MLDRHRPGELSRARRRQEVDNWMAVFEELSTFANQGLARTLDASHERSDMVTAGQLRLHARHFEARLPTGGNGGPSRWRRSNARSAGGPVRRTTLLDLTCRVPARGAGGRRHRDNVERRPGRRDGFGTCYPSLRPLFVQQRRPSAGADIVEAIYRQCIHIKEAIMSSETGHITGTADKDYNIIWFVEQCLSNVLRLSTYIEDAERAGDQELADFFRRAQAESRKGADQGKQLLRQRLTV
jgi:hypothetical protein